MSFFFPPPSMTYPFLNGGAGGVGGGPTSVPGPTAVTPPASTGGGGFWRNFRSNMGWTNPAIRSQMAAQMLSAPSLMDALGAMALGPYHVGQYEEEEARKKQEEEARKKDEEDRLLQRQINEARLRREKSAEQERKRDRLREDQEGAALRQARKAFNREIDAADLPDELKTLYKQMDPEEGRARYIERSFPTQQQQARLDLVQQQIESSRALTEQRQRPREPKETPERIHVKDRLQTLNSMIDDKGAALRRTDPLLEPEKAADLELEIVGFEAMRKRLLDRQQQLGGQPGDLTPSSGNEEILRRAMESAGAAPSIVESKIALARQRGIVDQVVALMGPPENLPLAEALRRASGM